jgi:hypothetical protein
MTTQTKPSPKVKLSVGRGRPKKTIRINRSLVVNFEDYKEAVTLMSQNKSLTKIEKSSNLTIKILRAIRTYAINNQVIAKKEGCSAGNIKRHARKMAQQATAKPVADLFTPINTSFLPETSKMSQKTLTIDFKGIMMQVEITSVEVKSDTIVVR